MNTRPDVVNDAFSWLDENTSFRESIIRLAFSAALLAPLVMHLAIVDQVLWVVMSVYLFTTAILRWDPFYALMKAGALRAELAHPVAGSEGAITTQRGASAAKYAANDSPGKAGLRKAG